MIAKAGEGKAFSSLKFAASAKCEHSAVVGVLKSLSAADFVVLEQKEERFYELTEEADEYTRKGSPEMQLLRKIEAAGEMPVSEAKSHSIGFGKCMRNKWVKREGDVVKPAMRMKDIVDVLADQLTMLKHTNGSEKALMPEDLKELSKRKLIKLISRKYYMVNKGSSWSAQRKKQPTTLTKEMLETGSWKGETFKAANWNSVGLKPQGENTAFSIGNANEVTQLCKAGYLHPLLLVRMEFRKILIGMGFEEMPTNKWVRICLPWRMYSCLSVTNA